MFTLSTIPVFGLNLAIAATLCLAIAFMLSYLFRSLPKRYGTLAVGLIASLLAPLAVALGTSFSLGMLPRPDTAPIAVEVPVASQVRENPEFAAYPTETQPRDTRELSPADQATADFRLLEPTLEPRLLEIAVDNAVAPPTSTASHKIGVCLMFVWLFGSTIMIVRYLRSILLCRRFLQICQPITDVKTRELFLGQCERLGIRGQFRLLESAVVFRVA